MDLTQEVVLSILIKEGGQVKNSEILSKFQTLINCSDPAEKKQNRDLFKSLVNNVAVVKELEDGKYIVLKKKYQHLLKHLSVENDESAKQHSEATFKDAADKVEECETLFQDGENVGQIDREETEPSTDSHDGNTSPCDTGEHSLIRLALERTRVDIKPKKALSFVQKQVMSLNEHSGEEVFPGQTVTANISKPCALPLRLPVSQTTESPSVFTEDSSSQEGDSVPNTPGNKRRPSVDSEGMLNSQLRRVCKNARPSEEPKHITLVPLEQNEHEWLVNSAAGQWGLVYGLLLKDAHLAVKRDFMSGFTALHWAAKCGNSKMVTKIIEVSRKFGSGVDVNAKTYGGYTPLHIAAIHHQEYIIAQLVEEYGADIRVRDNCGKRPYHYLHKGVRDTVREMLGEPKTRRQEGMVVPVKEEGEGTLIKGHSLTLTRLFHQPPSISLFHQAPSIGISLFHQPPTIGHLKLRAKHREVPSVTEEPLEV